MLITAADVLFIIIFGIKSFRFLEVLVMLLTLVITVCFAYELSVAKPDWVNVAQGFIPKPKILTNADILYAAIGIMGATVMPHNLYLHSSVVQVRELSTVAVNRSSMCTIIMHIAEQHKWNGYVLQTRAFVRSKDGKLTAIKYATIDCMSALTLAFLVNASMLIMAAAVFHYGSSPDRAVADIVTAYKLLQPALGDKVAPKLFGVALLCSGQQATITGKYLVRLFSTIS